MQSSLRITNIHVFWYTVIIHLTNNYSSAATCLVQTEHSRTTSTAYNHACSQCIDIILNLIYKIKCNLQLHWLITPNLLQALGNLLVLKFRINICNNLCRKMIYVSIPNSVLWVQLIPNSASILKIIPTFYCYFCERNQLISVLSLLTFNWNYTASEACKKFLIFCSHLALLGMCWSTLNDVHTWLCWVCVGQHWMTF